MNALSLAEFTPSIANGRSAVALSNPSMTSICYALAWHTFGPAGGDVSQRERMNKVTVGLQATGVFDHVDFEEARWRIAPVIKCAHRDASSNRCTHPLAALTLAVGVQPRIGQHAIDSRRAALNGLRFDNGIQVK
ncbi:hypothetical protein [Burkholderia sp. S171]|uniref:hypothetical protein n=1 Tax=Burkholderia sp. S171 TaxID=1641860 RepID=UPI00131BED46|nr:hypothetical protein [Burkholderia sp. S171]